MTPSSSSRLKELEEVVCVDNVIRDTAHKCPYPPLELAVRFGLEEFERNNCEPPLHDPVEYRFQLLRTWRQKLGCKATYGQFFCCLKRCLPTNQTFLEDTEELIITEHSIPTIEPSVENETSSSESMAMPMLNKANALLEISIENQKKFTRWTDKNQKFCKRTLLQLKREVKSLTKLVEKLKKEKEIFKSGKEDMERHLKEYEGEIEFLKAEKGDMEGHLKEYEGEIEFLKAEKGDMEGHLKEYEGEIEFLKAENKRLNNKLYILSSIQIKAKKPPKYCPIKPKEEKQQSDSGNSFDLEGDMNLSDGIQFILDTS